MRIVVAVAIALSVAFGQTELQQQFEIARENGR
jgi:hypothetical protein